MLNIVTTRWMMMAIASLTMSQCGLALFPGCCAGEEKREPGTHCLRMGQVPLVTCVYSAAQKLNFCLPAERPHCRVIILPVRHL